MGFHTFSTNRYCDIFNSIFFSRVARPCLWNNADSTLTLNRLLAFPSHISTMSIVSFVLQTALPSD